MRSRLLAVVTAVAVMAAACGETSAADLACDAREDLDEAIADVSEDIQEGNFGEARNEVDDVRAAYNRLRDAVTDLADEQEEALRDDTEALAADVAAIGEAQDLDQLGSLVDTALDDAQALLDQVASTLSCDD
jgi:chromosome segregation ATPase